MDGIPLILDNRRCAARSRVSCATDPAIVSASAGRRADGEGRGEMKAQRYLELKAAVAAAGYKSEIDWAESVRAPTNAVKFAGEVIWVILCSGMKEQVARVIQDRVWAAIGAGRPVKGSVLGRSGKADAIDAIWRDRDRLFAAFQAASDKVAFARSLPWIGPITCWHVAKNLGVDCAKPDVHLERVAGAYGTTPAALCKRLSKATGDRIATVDLVIWRACNLGIIDSKGLARGAANAALRVEAP